MAIKYNGAKSAKAADMDAWGTAPVLCVPNFDAKPVKNVYFVRTLPEAGTSGTGPATGKAASKPGKVSPQSLIKELKAPKAGKAWKFKAGTVINGAEPAGAKGDIPADQINGQVVYAGGGKKAPSRPITLPAGTGGTASPQPQPG
jgi:hypothetical protein